MDMYLLNKEHLGNQMHNKNDCCITEEHGMDMHLGLILKHPKNAANLLKNLTRKHGNHDYTVYNVLISVLKKFKFKKQCDQYFQVAE